VISAGEHTKNAHPILDWLKFRGHTTAAAKTAFVSGTNQPSPRKHPADGRDLLERELAAYG